MPYAEASAYVTVPADVVADAKRWRSVSPGNPGRLTDTPERSVDEVRARLGTEDERWVFDQLQRYRYKPTFTAEVVPTPGAAAARQWVPVTVRLAMWVLDSRGSDRVLPVVSTKIVPGFIVDGREADYFARWLHGQIGEMELHELDEWFRRDGELVDDPHRRPEPSTVGPIA